MRDERAKQSGDYSDPEVMVIGVRTRLQSAKGAKDVKESKGRKCGLERKCGTRTFGDIVIRNCM